MIAIGRKKEEERKKKRKKKRGGLKVVGAIIHVIKLSHVIRV